MTDCSLPSASSRPLPEIPIAGCAPVPVCPHADARGCLFEIFREDWPGAFRTVQWNACASRAGVMRGVHVHASPTFGVSIGFEWSAADGFAVPIPAGVAHAVFFLEASVLAFGLSDYWKAETDVLGCRWDLLDPALRWPIDTAALSNRDTESGSYEAMVDAYERLASTLA